MVYKKYGIIFRKLREQQGLPLSSFISLGISKAALSKFERGETMMSFEKVVSALQIIGVSLEEFEFFFNNYTSSDANELLKEINDATMINNFSKLNLLSKEAERLGFTHISLAAKSSYTALNTIESENITDYLYEIDIWSYKDLCVFYFCMENIKTPDILYILDIFLAGGHPLSLGKYKTYLVKACCRAVTILSSRGYEEFSQYVLDKIESYKLVNSMFLRNLRNITYGYWVYCFKDPYKGDEIMLKALKIFKDVSTPEVAKFYQERYNFYVKSSSL